MGGDGPLAKSQPPKSRSDHRAMESFDVLFVGDPGRPPGPQHRPGRGVDAGGRPSLGKRARAGPHQLFGAARACSAMTRSVPQRLGSGDRIWIACRAGSPHDRVRGVFPKSTATLDLASLQRAVFRVDVPHNAQHYAARGCRRLRSMWRALRPAAPFARDKGSRRAPRFMTAVGEPPYAAGSDDHGSGLRVASPTLVAGTTV